MERTGSGISIAILDIPPAVKAALMKEDIATLKDLARANLQTALDFSLHEHLARIQQELQRWLEIERTVLASGVLHTEPMELGDPHVRSLEPLLAEKEEPRRTIKVFPFLRIEEPARFERMLLNGIFGLGEVVELSGEAGVGKTQLAMQLCLNVQLSEIIGGVEGEALFIDTEGGFDAERLADMCRHLYTPMHAALIQQKAPPTLMAEYENEDAAVETMLRKVKYVRILEQKEQICLAEYLEETIKCLSKVYSPVSQ